MLEGQHGLGACGRIPQEKEERTRGGPRKPSILRAFGGLTFQRMTTQQLVLSLVLATMVFSVALELKVDD
ncbi:MAG TPA: hypothetical protein VK996_05670, partial [Ramlibacter sp.]|nr:hypothetical protein [Ramlibacter sp.]